mmetsp:Transcript_95043/g.307598  ORF Transcript_95043/g.307598 Transcript_95043/m.307598 type:complete len:1209 (-) Transcript_95043:421-4047(-)
MGNRWAKWLAERTCGVARVHWLVACGYVVAPVANTLGFVICTEWGLRGAINVPHWLFSVPEGAGVDSVLLNEVLFSINALGMAIGAPIWAGLCIYVAPRTLLAASLLLQVPLNLVILLMAPQMTSAMLVMFLYGLVSSSGLLFIVFNFMLSVSPDMSNAAVRMGFLEVCRYVVMWLTSAFVFFVQPTSQAGSAATPLPPSVLASLSPMVIVSVIFNLVPGLLLLAAPGPYRDDRFPRWDFRNAGKNLSFIFLCASEVVGALGNFPSTCYVMWWIANGWSISSLSWASITFAGLLALGTALWAALLRQASVHGYSFLIGVVLLLFPPAVLRAITLEEVSTFQSMGTSEMAMAISMFTLFYEGVRSSATWTAKIKILNSNWRLLSFGTVLLTCTNLMTAASPWVCELLVKSWQSTTFTTRNQKELADATMVVLVPICLLQGALQLFAASYIHQDMGLVPRARGSGTACKDYVKMRAPITFAVLVSIALGAIVVTLDMDLITIPQFYEAVYRCGSDIHVPKCKILLNETNTKEAIWDSWTYGPNKYGQMTTARYNCRMRMLSVLGDTFVFYEHGQCIVQHCGSADERRADGDQAILDGSEVWSKTCEMSGQNLVAVHLFEWPWDDVAKECQYHLRDSGVSMVQVSPATEHILGDSWAIRYQPVSFNLHSRGGTREQFENMVARCRENGIGIMVDVVLNHMAGPYVFVPKSDRGKYCGQAVDSKNSSTQPCVGWNGTKYGNREFEHGRRGKDFFHRRNFHHYDGNERANCGLPPWSNNRHLCDLSGLPDLDTESIEVQRMLRSFLAELFEIGVTHLRLDAAMLIYSESLAHILQPIPWDYVVQEFYPDQLEGTTNKQKAFQVGQVTDFSLGVWITQALLDSGNFNQGWQNRSWAFKQLMQAGSQPSSDCGYKTCVKAVEAHKGLVFIDNHDTQRERWKEPENPKPDDPPWKPPPAQCEWDGNDIGNCRLNYKDGLQYRLAAIFMLAFPVGDAARLISSYAWTHFDSGPPGVTKDSLHDSTTPVVCRGTPSMSPVPKEYDEDPNRWVCEHRWQGVLAMVRFRRQVGKRHQVQDKWDEDGGIFGYSLGEVGFVAFSRGYNNATGQGSREDFNLTGRQTRLKEGHYCNLAAEWGLVPPPERWAHMCTGGDPIKVGKEGRIMANGTLPSGGVVALHINYTTFKADWSDDDEALAASPESGDEADASGGEPVERTFV